MSIKYFPPAPFGDVAQFIYRELIALSRALDEPQQFMQLEVLHVEPPKPRNGMVVIADGTDWNPGGTGAGVYARIGGAWVKL